MPRPVGDQTTFRATPVRFEFMDLGECPICLAASPSSREHVPPHSIGGNALTLTCERCNNEFGSKLEPHLQGWYENSIGKVKMSGADVDGHRFAGEYLVRENAAGGFILFQQGKRDSAVDQILQNGGSFEMICPQADMARTHIGAVKTAYLAACVAMRVVPSSPRAEALRAELLAARDAPRSQRLELSPIPTLGMPDVRKLRQHILGRWTQHNWRGLASSSASGQMSATPDTRVPTRCDALPAKYGPRFVPR